MATALTLLPETATHIPHIFQVNHETSQMGLERIPQLVATTPKFSAKGSPTAAENAAGD